MNDLVVSDGEIKQITSTAGVLNIVIGDWKGTRWLLSINDLIAFESISAEGETLGEFIIQEQSEYKDKILKFLPDETNLTTRVYIFTSAWSGLPVLQAIGTTFQAQPLSGE